MEQIIAGHCHFTNIARSNFLLLLFLNLELHEPHLLLRCWWEFPTAPKLSGILNLKPFKLNIVDMNWIRRPIIKYLTQLAIWRCFHMDWASQQILHFLATLLQGILFFWLFIYDVFDV